MRGGESMSIYKLKNYSEDTSVYILHQDKSGA